MGDFSAIDQNFALPEQKTEGVVWRSAMDAPFTIHGLMYEDGVFRRMPSEVAKTVSNGVYKLHICSSGGRVRFCTDSPFISIRTKIGAKRTSARSPLTGIAGFDLYMGKRHVKAFEPPEDFEDGYERQAELPEKGMHEITIFFPLHVAVLSLDIGLAEGCRLEAAPPYPNEKPIVFYGSSITQGASASRAGNCYTNAVCRMLGRDIWNLGFLGNAKGEPQMAEYIAGLDMECFVLDYDYNAKTTEDLENTHEALFRAVRQAHPDIPILMMGRPQFIMTESMQRRIHVIRRTYDNAKAAGDENVYTLFGPELMAIAGMDGVNDGCHPNDLGFFSMAQAVYGVLKNVLK